MPADFASVETLMSEASTAILAADYATAETKAVAAQALLMALPSIQMKSGFAGGAMHYTPENINEFLKNVRRLAANANAAANAHSGGMVLMPLEMASARCRDV